MKAYQLDVNGFFISEVECQKNPLEAGKFLTPGGAVTDPPPAIGENQIAKYENGNWTVLPNYSKKVYFHKETKLPRIFEIGEEFDDNYTDLTPIQSEAFQKFENGNWVVDVEAKYAFLRENLLTNVKRKFESLVANYRSTVLVNGISWDSGQKYLNNIDTLLKVYAINPETSFPQWRDASNQFHTLSLNQFQAIEAAIRKDMYEEGLRLYQIKWQKETQIDNLADSELASYDPLEGWENG